MKNLFAVISFTAALTVGTIFGLPILLAPKLTNEIVEIKAVEVEKTALPKVEFPHNKSGEVIEAPEIISCVPQKIYRGETLKVSLGKTHGGNAAILRVADDNWFFLNYVENSQPVWSVEEFELLSDFEINTTSAVNSTNTIFEEGRSPEKVFKKTGRYRIMTSREDFGQCDPPVSGMCEVYYVNKKRPHKK